MLALAVILSPTQPGCCCCSTLVGVRFSLLEGGAASTCLTAPVRSRRVVGRRGFQSMVVAGMNLAKAAGLVGLMDAEA